MAIETYFADRPKFDFKKNKEDKEEETKKEL